MRENSMSQIFVNLHIVRGDRFVRGRGSLLRKGGDCAESVSFPVKYTPHHWRFKATRYCAHQGKLTTGVTVKRNWGFDAFV